MLIPERESAREPSFDLLELTSAETPVAVLLLALLIHGGVLLLSGSLRADPDGYRRLAENLVEHGTFGSRCPLGRYQGDIAISRRRRNSQGNGHFAAKIGTVDRAHGLPPAVVSIAVDRLRGAGITAARPSRVLHLPMGVATVGLVLLLGRWWGLGDRAGGAGLRSWSPATPSCYVNRPR